MFLRIFSTIFFIFIAVFTTVQAQSNSILLALVEEGALLVDSSEFKRAIIVYEEAAKLAEQSGLHQINIHCKNEISNAYLSISSYDTALSIITLNLKTAIKILGEEESETADSYHYSGLALMRKGQLDEALEMHHRALTIREKINATPLDLAKSYLQIGHTYLYKNNETPALKFLSQALIYAQKNSKANITLGKTYRHLGNYYYGLMDYDKSLKYNIKSLEILDQICVKKDPLRSYAISNIGELYTIMGNYKKAQEYLNKAKHIAAESKDIAQFASSNNYLGKLNEHTNNYDLAKKYQLEALENWKEVHPQKDHVRIANTYQNLGELDLKLGHHDSSLSYFKMALSIREEDYQKGNGNYLYLIELYNGLGKVYELRQDWEIAKIYYNKALNIGLNKSKSIDNNPLFLINVYNNLATLFLKTNEFESALEDINKAIQINEKDELRAFNQLQLLRSYQLKTELFFKQWISQKDESYLNLSSDLSITMDRLISRIQTTYQNDEDRILFNELVHESYGIAIQICHQQYQIEGRDSTLQSAFYYMEKDKANTLTQALKANEALHNADVPDTLIILEKTLRLKINNLTKKTHQAYLKQDSTDIAKWEGSLFSTNNQYESLLKSLEKNHPRYYQLKYEDQILSLTDIQNKLSEHTALLEYFVGDTSIFVLSVEKDDINFVAISKPKNWEYEIFTFRSLITHSAIELEKKWLERIMDFKKSSNKLYNILLTQPLSLLDEKITHLQIIPDSELSIIPFDLLTFDDSLTKKSSYKSLNYVLHKYNINYAYSTSLLYKTVKTFKVANQQFYAGFAPEYAESASYKNTIVGGLKDLPAARQGVISNASLLDGEAFVGKASLKKTFLNNINRFRILHLAMHALVDDKNPMYSKLMFMPDEKNQEDHFLNTNDIYNLNIKADLVVLSACNTGYGQIKKGEGVMSLSRAFTYAGCSSTVMSLWEIPDKQTSAIISSFFQALTTGQQKDEALRTAKLAYLKDCPPSLSHPLYWAGFVTMGKNEALINNRNYFSNWWVIALSFIALSFGLFLLKRLI